VQVPLTGLADGGESEFTRANVPSSEIMGLNDRSSHEWRCAR